MLLQNSFQTTVFRWYWLDLMKRFLGAGKKSGIVLYADFTNPKQAQEADFDLTSTEIL